MCRFVEKIADELMKMKTCCGLLLTAVTAIGFGSIKSYPLAPSTATSGFQGFRVDIALSEKARKKLTENKETLKVVSYFTGTPKSGLPLKQYKQYLSRPGPIGLGEIEVEVAPGDSANFRKIKLNQNALAQIDSQGPQILINVFSGRKSSQANLLECDIYEGSLESAERKSIPIHCKLIGE